MSKTVKRIALVLLVAGAAVGAMVAVPSDTARAYYTLPDPLTLDACITSSCIYKVVGGDGASIADYGYVASGDGAGVGAYIESLLQSGWTAEAATAIETEGGIGTLGDIGVSLGLLASPAAISILGAAALTIGAVAIEKKFHVGSLLHNWFTDYKANAFVDASGDVVPIHVEAWVANMNTSYGGFEPAVAGWAITLDNRSGGRNATFVQGSAAAIIAGGCTAAYANEVQAVLSMGLTIVTGAGTACGGLPVVSAYFTADQYDTAFKVTGQPWHGQTVDATNGNPNPNSGLGIRPNQGAQPQAPPTALSNADPTVYCSVQGAAATSCPGTAQHINAKPTHTKNLLRCKGDTTGRYTCPSTSGGTFSGSDGLITSNYIVPGCEGFTITECEILLNQTALRYSWAAPAFTVVTAAIAAANPDYPPGAVISTSPEGGATVSANTDFTITTNPSVLPIILPFPQPWESASAYAARLTKLGIPYSIATASLGATPATIGPGEVVGTSPVPGTLINPTTTTVVVTQGNLDAPYPNGDPNAPGVVIGPGGCNCGRIAWPTIALGTAFPFGIFTWLNDLFSGFTTSGSCPTVYLGKPDAIGGGTQPVSLCSSAWEGTWRPVLFPIIEFFMTLAAVAFVALKIVGLGGGGDD